MKINNDIIDNTENNITKLEFIVLLKSAESEFPNSVIEIRKEDIVTVRAMAPLISIFLLNDIIYIIIIFFLLFNMNKSHNN